jgi:hypothetical protein
MGTSVWRNVLPAPFRQVGFNHEDRGSTFLWNFDVYLPNYTASHLRTHQQINMFKHASNNSIFQTAVCTVQWATAINNLPIEVSSLIKGRTCLTIDTLGYWVLFQQRRLPPLWLCPSWLLFAVLVLRPTYPEQQKLYDSNSLHQWFSTFVRLRPDK